MLQWDSFHPVSVRHQYQFQATSIFTIFKLQFVRKETNTGHSYAPDDKYWFSLGTAVRLEKNKKNKKKQASYLAHFGLENKSNEMEQGNN